MAGSKQHTMLPAPADLHATPGAQVTVAIDPTRLNRAALLGYLLPAVGLVIGAALGDALGNDPGAVLGGLSGLVLGIAAGRLSAALAPQLRAEISTPG